MKKIGFAFAFLTILACSNKKKSSLISIEGEAQGTTYHIAYINSNGVNYQRAIDSLLIEIDKSLSTYHKTSIITKFNQADSLVEIDEMFTDVFNLSKQVYQESEGAFNPTVAHLVNAWGFGFKNIENTDSSTIDSLLKFVDFDAISIIDNKVVKTNKNLMLDFNAIAQGYSVDVIADFLANQGIENYMVEIGGEVKVKGKNDKNKLWRIGIDKPVENETERTLEAVVNLNNQSLATSGNYRKFYEKDGAKYSHTLNPKTGYPVRHSLLSATVITDNCALADAYATVFMVVGIDKAKEILAKNNKIKAVLIFENENKQLETYVSEELVDFIELNDK
ncbi:MAG: FAD:protein FMN transferase [Flavobacteriales bacterium]|nr:FAD:protein FMN transferase [Flavobacteriales bacterium]